LVTFGLSNRYFGKAWIITMCIKRRAARITDVLLKNGASFFTSCIVLTDDPTRGVFNPDMGTLLRFS